MEITNEIKARVFAQYFGQNVWKDKQMPNNIFQIDQIKLSIIEERPDDFHLVLNPLSAITDEDAAIAGGLLDFKKDENLVTNGKTFIRLAFIDKKPTVLQRHPLYIIDAYQYLQSKGYDLPNFLLEGQTLQEAGLAIYE